MKALPNYTRATTNCPNASGGWVRVPDGESSLPGAVRGVDGCEDSRGVAVSHDFLPRCLCVDRQGRDSRVRVRVCGGDDLHGC